MACSGSSADFRGIDNDASLCLIFLYLHHLIPLLSVWRVEKYYFSRVEGAYGYVILSCLSKWHVGCDPGALAVRTMTSPDSVKLCHLVTSIRAGERTWTAPFCWALTASTGLLLPRNAVPQTYRTL